MTGDWGGEVVAIGASGGSDVLRGRGHGRGVEAGAADPPRATGGGRKLPRRMEALPGTGRDPRYVPAYLPST